MFCPGASPGAMSSVERLRGKVVVVVLAVVFSLAGVVLGQAGASGERGARAPGAGGVNEGFEGLVKPSRRVVLHAPVEERVEAIKVAEGQFVEAGALLVRMNEDVQAAVVERAELRAADETPVRFAELALEEAELRLKQVRRAFEGDAANELEVISARVARDQAEVRLESARQEREQARVELELERRRLDRYRITAPFDGVIVNIASDQGASLTREEPIIELAALHPLEAEVYLPARLFGRQEKGRRYKLSAGAPVNGTLEAVLDRVVPVIDPGSRSFKAVFVIDNAEGELPSGFTVRVEKISSSE